MSKSNPTPSHIPIDSAATPLGRGAIIGRYVVLGLVGRGGMGEVYAAYDPELDRKVAVKLLRVKAGNGVSLTEGRQRTLREAQAIARLSDPNVVVVYDVGTFEDKVFIAMEFVDGNTVTFWLEQKPRSWQEILRVFISAGRGLTAAHEKGLVHRDFKPDNVMVGRDGQVRVMDFGLARQMDKPGIKEHRLRGTPPGAKRGDIEVGSGTLPLEHRAVPIDEGTLVLNPGLADSGADMQSSVSGLFDARLTRTGAMMGTPAYMAPEQFFGKETDARTDQFSFCVALYESLYGERPFPGKKLTELTANVVQGTIRAAPPGTKVPFWVRRILLRGLRSAPAERYPSMGELLAALGKDPRATQRKWAVGAAVAMLPLAIGLGVRQSLIDRRAICDGAGERLAGIWDLHPPDQPEGPRQSQIHAAFMRTGKSYAADVYETVTRALTSYAQSWTTMYKQTCEATQVHHEQSAEVLDLRMSCLNERLNGLRALTDVFADATGDVVENAVSATNALTTLDRCADVPTLRAVIKPPDDPTTVAKVAGLRKQLAEVKARFDAGNWKEGLSEGPRLVSEARAVAYQPLLAESLLLLGRMFIKSNKYLDTERAFREAFAVAEASRHDEVRGEAAESLVFVVGYQGGHFAEAYNWEQITTAILDRVGGHDLMRAWLFNDLGCVLELQGRYAESIQAASRAVELKQKTLGEGHPDIGISEMNLAISLKDAGRREEALTHIERALKVMEKGLGAGHPDVAMAVVNLGEIQNDLGRYHEAHNAFERARTIWERELGPESLPLAYALTDIGLTYLAEGDSLRALAPLEKAHEIRESKEPEHSRRAETTFALARALWESARDRGRARSLVDQAVAEYSKASSKEKVLEVQSWLKNHSSS
jgi:serine/threonine protein kinase/tetratricopeptide (TPR) repeat protein